MPRRQERAEGKEKDAKNRKKRGNVTVTYQ
jgi:hypothetical protein